MGYNLTRFNGKSQWMNSNLPYLLNRGRGIHLALVILVAGAGIEQMGRVGVRLVRLDVRDLTWLVAEEPSAGLGCP
jgi:hypothetical protein